MAICKNCNKEFNPVNKKKDKFCCMNCYRETQRKGVYKKGSSIPTQSCTNCGKPVRRVFVKNRKGESCDKIFCCRKCYDEYRIINTKKIIYKCKECGKDFKDDSRGHVFCSMECRNKNITAVERECVGCGKMFYPSYTDKKGRVHHPNSRKTCSPECVRKNFKENEERKKKISDAFTGEKHPGWLGGRRTFRGENWRRNKRAAIKRDKECKHCGMSPEESKEKYKANLEVHHIKPFRYFDTPEEANNLENLITLCKSCHKKAEWEFHKNRGTFLNGNKVDKKINIA